MTGRGRNAARAVVLVTAAALVTGSTPGCSILFVKPPPPTEARGPVVRCTSSDLFPVIDTLLALVQTVRFSFAYSATESDYANSGLSRDGDMMVSAGLFGLLALSAGVGFANTSECRAARATTLVPDPSPPRIRRPRPPPPPPPPPAPEQQEADAGRPDAGSPVQPDAGAPAPAVVVPDEAPAPRAPAVRQRVDPE